MKKYQLAHAKTHFCERWNERVMVSCKTKIVKKFQREHLECVIFFNWSSVHETHLQRYIERGPRENQQPIERGSHASSSTQTHVTKALEISFCECCLASFCRRVSYVFLSLAFFVSCINNFRNAAIVSNFLSLMGTKWSRKLLKFLTWQSRSKGNISNQSPFNQECFIF